MGAFVLNSHIRLTVGVALGMFSCQAVFHLLRSVHRVQPLYTCTPHLTMYPHANRCSHASLILMSMSEQTHKPTFTLIKKLNLHLWAVWAVLYTVHFETIWYGRRQAGKATRSVYLHVNYHFNKYAFFKFWALVAHSIKSHQKPTSDNV